MSVILEARLKICRPAKFVPDSWFNCWCLYIQNHSFFLFFCFGEAKWRQMLAKVLYHIPYLSPNFSLSYPVASWTYWQSMEWYELTFLFFFRKTNYTKPTLCLNERAVGDCPSAMHLLAPRQGARSFGYVGWHCRLLIHSFPLPFQITKPSSKLVLSSEVAKSWPVTIPQQQLSAGNESHRVAKVPEAEWSSAAPTGHGLVGGAGRQAQLPTVHHVSQ